MAGLKPDRTQEPRKRSGVVPDMKVGQKHRSGERPGHTPAMKLERKQNSDERSSLTPEILQRAADAKARQGKGSRYATALNAFGTEL